MNIIDLKQKPIWQMTGEERGNKQRKKEIRKCTPTLCRRYYVA